MARKRRVVSEEVEEVEIEDEAEVSVEDDLEAAFADVEADDEDSSDSDDAEVEETGDTDDADDDAEEDEAEAEDEEGAEDDDTGKDEGDEDEGKVEAVKPESVTGLLSKDDRAKFEKLPEDTKTFVAGLVKRWQDDSTQRGREFAETQRAVQGFHEALAPVHQELEKAGIDPVQGVRMLVTAHQGLQTKPIDSILWLLDEYGIPLDQVVEAAGGIVAPGARQDPAASQRNQQQPRRTAPVVPTASADQVRQSQRQEVERFNYQRSQTEAAAKAIDDFKSQRNEDGSPKYPHFDAAAKTMGALMAEGSVKSIEEAYETAIWAIPEVRRQLVDRQKEETDRERQRRSKEAAKKVRRSSAGQRRSAPAKAKPKPSSTRPEVDLTEVWDELAT